MCSKHGVCVCVCAYCKLEKSRSVISCPLSINYLREQQLLEGVAVCKQALLPQARLEQWHICPVCHTYFVERLSVSPLKVLHDHVTVNKV